MVNFKQINKIYIEIISVTLNLSSDPNILLREIKISINKAFINS